MGTCERRRHHCLSDRHKEHPTSVASLKNTLLVACFWKYAANGARHAASAKRTDAGCTKTRSPPRRSYSRNSRAVFSRWTVPACTRSNLIAARGSTARATCGQSAPRMTALSRFWCCEFALSEGSEDAAEGGTKPSSEREEEKSCRREVMSRIVVGEMKFYGTEEIISPRAHEKHAYCPPLRRKLVCCFVTCPRRGGDSTRRTRACRSAGRYCL